MSPPKSFIDKMLTTVPLITLNWLLFGCYFGFCADNLQIKLHSSALKIKVDIPDTIKKERIRHRYMLTRWLFLGIHTFVITMLILDVFELFMSRWVIVSLLCSEYPRKLVTSPIVCLFFLFSFWDRVWYWNIDPSIMWWAMQREIYNVHWNWKNNAQTVKMCNICTVNCRYAFFCCAKMQF